MITILDKYKHLKYYERLEQALLILMAITIPVWWRLSVIVSFLLLANLVFKSLVTHHVGNPSLSRIGIASWVAALGFVSMYAVSLLYTDNIPKGLTSLERHLTLICMALFFLLSDLTYMRKAHVVTVLYAMSVALIIRFIVFLVLAIRGFFFVHHDIQLIIGGHFDSMHHSYLSMYILLSIAFLYSRLVTVRTWRKACLLLLAIIILATYIFFIQARMGFLLLTIFLLFAIVHQILVYRRFLVGFMVIFFFAIGALVLVKAAPLMTQRFTNISQIILDSQHSDSRYSIMNANLSVIKQNHIWGVGAGDVVDQLSKEYDKEIPNSNVVSPHNQFMDTLMATGIIGLVLLLIMLVLPFIQAVRDRNYLQLVFVVIIIVCALTESILERQMGLYFFCLFMGILPCLAKASKEKS